MFTIVRTVSGATYVLFTNGSKTFYVRTEGPRIVGTNMTQISGTMDKFPRLTVGESMTVGTTRTSLIESIQTFGV